MKDALERVDLPDAEGARERGWQVVEAAFEGREPVPRERRRWPVVVALAAAVVVAALASPPGRAVLDEIREAVGVERAQPALFSLPARGRLLVGADDGLWVVQRLGGKRRLGTYREASWSPFGRFVAAAKRNELAALEPNGAVRWTLARPDVRFPRWTGSATDTRIAFLTAGRLHVVAGDGTGDAASGGLPAAAPVAPAWQPGGGFVLAYVTTRGRVYAFDVASGTSFRRFAPAFPEPRQLAWSDDGRRLLLVTRTRLVVFAPGRPTPLAERPMSGVSAAAFEPGTRRVALLRDGEVLLVDVDRLRAPVRRLFAGGSGPFEGLAWSPEGRWLLVGWPEADQWVFVRADGKRIRAVANVSDQFRSRGFPRVESWCCAR